jgi:subtilisin family serine protease
MDPKLWELLRKGKDNEEVEAIIRLDQPQHNVSGLRIVSRFGPIATCRLKTKEIIRTREAENVLSLKAAVRLAPEKEPDDSYGQFDFPRNTSQNRLRRPKELSQTGAGVVIGIVDFGCDFNHPDLKNEDGSTRLLALWDQGGNGSTSIENKFGYGTIFTRQHID